MCIEVVGSLVGEIEWGDGVLTPDARYRAHSLNTACACKLLAVMVVAVRGLGWICASR